MASTYSISSGSGRVLISQDFDTYLALQVNASSLDADVTVKLQQSSDESNYIDISNTSKVLASASDTALIETYDFTLSECYLYVDVGSATTGTIDIYVSDKKKIDDTLGVQSVDNSSTTPLNTGVTFTGTGEQNDYPDVMVQVATDQNGIIYCEFSPDGTNWDTSLTFNYDTSRINPPHIFVKGSRYFRVKFENDSGSNQTYLRLYTYYGSFNKLTAPINGTLSENYDAIVTRPTQYNYEVAEGKRQGRSTVNKFAYNSDVDTATTEIVASFGGAWTTANIMTTADTLDVVSTSANDASAGSGAQTILITGIDANFLTQTETVTMNGVTPVTTSNSWLGVNRVVVLSSGTSDTNEGTITIDDTAGTVGTQAEIAVNSSVTQQAIYHTQINHNLLLDWLWVNIRKLSGGGGSPRVTIRGYSYSRVTDTAYEIFDYDVDTDVDNSLELRPSQPFVLGGREVVYFTAETNTNNTSVRLRFSGIEQRVD